MTLGESELSDFAVWLQERMDERKLNQRQLAAQMNRSPQMVSGWFHHGVRPLPDVCLELARVLHIDPQEVMRRADRLHLAAEEKEPYDELPDWVRLIPLLSDEDRAYAERFVRLAAKDQPRLT